MKWLLLFTLLVVIANASEDCDDYDDYDETFKCNKCYSEEYTDKFGLTECEETVIEETLSKEDKVKPWPCCSSGEFGFKCESEKCESNKWYCGSGGSTAVNTTMNFSCPDHCTTKLTDQYCTTDLDKDGKLVLKHENAKVEDYCVAPQCPNSNGPTVMPVCLCPEDLKVESQKYDAEIPRCCNEDSITAYDTQQASFDKYTCVSEQNKTDGNFSPCQTAHFLPPKQMTDNFKYVPDDDVVCLAFVLPESKYSPTIIQPKILRCKSPCDGEHPCLRLCNDKNDTVRAKMLEDSLFSELTSLNIKTEMSKAPQPEQKSRNSQKNGKKLETLNQSKCIGRFRLEKDSDSKEINLIRSSNERKYGPKEFCLTFNEDQGIIGAEVLKEDIKKDIGYYDLLLWISAVMVLLILFIHYAYKNQLVKKPGDQPDHPTIMLLFFTVSVFMVYFLKSCNQIKDLNYDHPKLCRFLGFAQQFSILSMFSFLTSYGIEVLLLIYGWKPSEYRLKVLMGKSLILPVGFSLMTGMTEALAPECIPLKPSFGEGNRCFFASEMAEAFWYLIPIGIYLLINAVLFILACYKVYMDDEQDIDNPLNTTLRDDNMQNYVTYVKLLFGFTILWILQLVAGFKPTQSNWNMKCWCDILLGWYVFICLVCTRKVSRVICSKRKFNVETNQVEIVPLRQHVQEKIMNRRTRVPSQVRMSEIETQSTQSHLQSM